MNTVNIKLFVEDKRLLATFYWSVIPRVGETIMAYRPAAAAKDRFVVNEVVWDFQFHHEPTVELYCGEIASYEDGKEEGYASGFEAGRQDGWEAGYEEGKAEGREDGYASGYAEAQRA